MFPSLSLSPISSQPALNKLEIKTFFKTCYCDILSSLSQNPNEGYGENFMILCGVVGGVGGPCDYCVSPVQRIGFLGFLDLGLGFGDCWDRGLGTWTRA